MDSETKAALEHFRKVADYERERVALLRKAGDDTTAQLERLRAADVIVDAINHYAGLFGRDLRIASAAKLAKVVRDLQKPE